MVPCVFNSMGPAPAYYIGVDMPKNRPSPRLVPPVRLCVRFRSTHEAQDQFSSDLLMSVLTRVPSKGLKVFQDIR